MVEKQIPVVIEDAFEFPRFGKLVRVKPGDTLVPVEYKKYANALYNFKYKSDDICLFTYPKSGTNWAAGIIWSMLHIDELERALTENLIPRFILLDDDFLNDILKECYIDKLKAMDPNASEDGAFFQMAALTKERRFLWSHLPFDLHNPNVLDTCKVVYVIREPKDNMFSRHVHLTKIVSEPVSIETSAETFMTGDTIFGNYWHHVREAWKRKDHPNLLIMFYEDMKVDIMHELNRMNSFFGTSLTQDQLKRVAEFTSFSNMKANPTMTVKLRYFSGSFLNKGQIGSSKGQLKPELDTKFDDWIKKNASEFGPSFKYNK